MYQVNSLIRGLKPSHQNTQQSRKKHYPGIKHENKYLTARTQVYQCIKLLQHISRHICKFGRYLRMRYDSQSTNNPTKSCNNNPNIEKNSTPTNHDTPIITNNEQEILRQNLTYIQQETPKSSKIKKPNKLSQNQVTNIQKHKPHDTSTTAPQPPTNPNNQTANTQQLTPPATSSKPDN